MIRCTPRAGLFRSDRTGGGESRRIAESVEAWESPAKAGRPVSIS